MYAVTSMPFDSRTRATFRRAEFGFLGVIVLTTVQTPRFCGQPWIAGCFGLDFCGTRGVFTNWLIVGIPNPCRPVRTLTKNRPGQNGAGRMTPEGEAIQAKTPPRRQWGH
jgi:hypothetical protein